MSKFLQFSGLIGFIVFVFGLVTFLIIEFDPYYFVSTHILFGLALLAVFVVRGGLRPVGKAAVRRAAGFGAGVTLYSALFVGLLAVANYFVARHDPLRYDSTEQKVFTLAPQTISVLERLPEPVMVRGFFVGGVVPPETEDLMRRLEKASEKISFTVIDPEKRPEQAERYGISERDTLHFSYKRDDSTREAKAVRELGEQEVVNALLKLTRGGEKKVYYLTGHGESNLDESSEAGFLFLKEAIQGENIVAEQLDLISSGAVPADASALLVMAPRKNLLPLEREAIDSYLAKGGNALLLQEPNTTDDVAQIAAGAGIAVGKDIVLDQVVRLFAGPGVGVQPLVSSFGAHPSVEGFSEGVIFSTVSSVRKSESAPDGADVAELAFTSENSWAETNVDLVFSDEPQAAVEAEDTEGPVPVAAAFEGLYRANTPADEAKPESAASAAPAAAEPAASPAADADAAEDKPAEQAADEQAAEKAKSRIIVIGDADFVANINIRQLFNRDFFLNALNWVVGQEESVTIRAKTMRKSTTALTAEQFRLIFLTTAVLLPEIVIIFGFSIWWFRK